MLLMRRTSGYESVLVPAGKELSPCSKEVVVLELEANTVAARDREVAGGPVGVVRDVGGLHRER